MSNKIRYRYYYNWENNKVEKARIRYIVYGSVILALAVALFILEAFFGFGITRVLDYFVSIAMFVDMGIGIIYIIKGITLTNGIRTSFFFNTMNTKIVEGQLKKSIGLIRILSIIPTIFNISIIVFYISTMYYRNDQMSVVLIISFIVALLLEIATIMAMISIDYENEIYDRIE